VEKSCKKSTPGDRLIEQRFQGGAGFVNHVHWIGSLAKRVIDVLSRTWLPDFSRFSYQKGKYIPNNHTIYQMATKYTKWPQNMPKWP
jgi:hypothetical protein